ncbi:CAP domain-containing protein [Nitratiruptor tergarcus]|uniref:Cysteine-rich secretory protein family protein n=1 Tax=Nitratiruptor tergarcus DSM 16512 TaxID=1069081 RepID=A0A1W1WRY1_9BACT|nr:CAP domain-containing protein [Nitratiruptor tergarcus]SMC08473.1 Cysteine-rich secretory protein family protein [Nitratiruptor tergarcus DSM 16512]
MQKVIIVLFCLIIFAWGDKNEAYSYLSSLRSAATLNSFTKNRYLDIAAQKHSDYMALHEIVSTYEDSSKTGYTGYRAKDRAIDAGFQSRWVIENVKKTKKDIKQAIDELMAEVDNRFIFLNPYMNIVGIGEAKRSEYNYYTFDIGNSYLDSLCRRSDTYSSGRYYYNVCADTDKKIDHDLYLNEKKRVALGNPAIVVWPTESKKVYPALFDLEGRMDCYFAGYPITMEFNQYKIDEIPTILSFSLKNQAGEPVTLQKCKVSDYKYAFIPINRLLWNRRYRVEVEYSVGDSTFTKSWNFYTEDPPYPMFIVYKNEDNKHIYNITSDEIYALYVEPKDCKDKLKSVYWNRYGVENIEAGFLDRNTIWFKMRGTSGCM